jgi:uncharacterized membrane protein YqhA
MSELPKEAKNQAESIFEVILWNSRLMIVIPVIMSLVAAFGVLFITTIDALGLFSQIFAYVDPNLTSELRDKLRLEVLAQVVNIIDGYLLAAIMLIFALGLYELFVGKINVAEGSSFAARLLHIDSIDDLKDRLARVVLIILIVKFFQLALGLSYTTPQDLLILALSVLLIGGALYLSSH